MTEPHEHHGSQADQQSSSVRIETNSKGMAQVKICVYAGETEQEMERVRALAFKTFTDLRASLGRLAQFV